jgi:hypothetical protein
MIIKNAIIIKQHEYFHEEIKKKVLNIIIRYENDDLRSIVEIIEVQPVVNISSRRNSVFVLF